MSESAVSAPLGPRRAMDFVIILFFFLNDKDGRGRVKTAAAAEAGTVEEKKIVRSAGPWL